MSKKVHLIGNAHLDPIWQWPWQEGYAEIKATYISALDRMRHFDDFVFTCAGASTYQWVEENCPEMFEEIRRRVREGRWVIVGGWWVQPDCNMPSGESFARHSLYSQRYFLEKFGVMAKTGYNVDSFGHSQMLPQILRKSGMENYVFMRPNKAEKDLPYSLFWWEAPDGSRVLTYRIPIAYCTRDNTPEGLEKHLRECYAEVSALQDTDMMLFYGVGNHGGGPTVKTIRIFEELQGSFQDADLVFSSPDAYFDSIRRQKAELPVVSEDLQHHASGCYSALSAIKQTNRLAENRLASAETMAVLSQTLMRQPYPLRELGKAWESVLFCQFHDVLCGCAVKAAYADAFHFLGESLSAAAKITNSAAQRISWAIDTMQGMEFPLSKDGDWAVWEHETLGTPLVVFNPNGFPVSEYVRVNKPITSVTDVDGRDVPMQRVRSACSNGDTDIIQDGLFLAEVPAMGYRVYRVFMSRPQPELDSPRAFRAEAGRMENDWYILELDTEQGGIRSLLDKNNQRDVFSGTAAAALVIDDTDADTWSHGRFSFDTVTGRFSDATLTVIESGALEAKIRIENRYRSSTLTQDFTMYRDKPDIEVNVRLNWQEPDTMLKLAFPADISGAQAVYEIPFGFIRKPADGQEEPAQRWAAVTNGENTLGIVSDAKYSCCAAGG